MRNWQKGVFTFEFRCILKTKVQGLPHYRTHGNIGIMSEDSVTISIAEFSVLQEQLLELKQEAYEAQEARARYTKGT